MIIPLPNKIKYDDKKFLSYDVKAHFTSLIAEEKIDDSLATEGYVFEVNSKGIIITHKTQEGRARALSTLEQLFELSNGSMPYVTIQDEPKMDMRSYMLDVSRYFFPLDEVLKQIDYLALYKFNTLHLHLNDDQGWRVEIKAYPKLTEIGSKRSRTLFKFKKHQGYYTQEELKTIVSYAHSKGIKVMPEIDLPGHFQSAIASYPELGCFGKGVKVAKNFGIKYDVACLGRESTKQFILTLIDELCEIFTDEYFHIGGDEVPSHRWSLCPDCAKKMQEYGAKDYKEYQAYFVNEIADYLIKKGKTPVAWNESEPTGIADRRIVWECWDIDFNSEAFKKEIANGRKIINAKTKPYYLDLPSGINSLESVYENEPEVFKDNLIGAEMCLWSELVPNPNNARKKCFPRLLAGAERFWSYQKDYDDFNLRLGNQSGILKKLGAKELRKYRNDPKGIVKICSKIWWARRMLYWGGLENLIKNAKVEHLKNKG